MFLIIAIAVLIILYWYYSNANLYWKRRNITGPEPEFLLGNLRSMWSYDKPRSLVFRDWTKQYGKVYGIFEGQRRMLVTSDFEMINEILVKKFDHFHARSRFAFHGTKDGPETHMVDARGAHWKRLRALGSYGFTNKSLKQIIPTIEGSAKILVDELEKYCGTEINMLQYLQALTLDVICKVAMGMKDVDMFDNQYLEPTKGVFSSPYSSPMIVLPSVFPFIANGFRDVLKLVAKIAPIKFFEMLDQVRVAVVQRKKERDAGAPSTGDFIDIFLDAEVDLSEVEFGHDTSTTGRKLVLDEVVLQCLLFLLAGFDTTSNSLSYTTYFLATHPDVQEKLREEIDAVCTDEEIDFEQIGELKYTESVIKETLRHFPLGSVAVTRECTKATVINGHQFDVGDMVFTDTWSLHMDKQIWGEDAEEFRPERWLEEDNKVPRAAFQAFGEGPRMCIGIRLAMIEEKIALVRILKKFVIEKTTNTDPLSLIGSMTVSPEKVMVKLVKRN